MLKFKSVGETDTRNGNVLAVLEDGTLAVVSWTGDKSKYRIDRVEFVNELPPAPSEK